MKTLVALASPGGGTEPIRASRLSWIAATLRKPLLRGRDSASAPGEVAALALREAGARR